MDLTGRSIGNYRITDEIGRGGMAVVYRAHQPSLNRDVAIKVLPTQLSFDQEFVQRFQREAQAAARLRHPNIVVIHDVDHQDDIYFIVMEYLEGRTLKQLIEQEGSLPPPRALHIAEQIAAALDFAHQAGFVHRDVKPSNIFVGQEDHITLTDFGIAKAASEPQQLTRTGMLMGTPEYVSPEQAEGGPVDHRSDLYALGVVLYQMLVGRVPFRGTTPHATLHAVIYEPPPPPRFINPNISPAIEVVVLKAISKQPEQRFQQGDELVAALGSAIAHREYTLPPSPPIPAPPMAPPPAIPPAGRSPLGWILAGVAAVLVIVLTIFAVLLITGDTDGQPMVPPTTVSVARTTPTSPSPVQTPTSTPTASLAPSTPTSEPPVESSETPTALPTNTSPPPTEPSLPTDTVEPPTATPTPTTTPSSTPTPTSTPSPSPTPCAFPAQGTFAGLWQTYRTQLGCPLYQDPKPIQDAEQVFESGHMFWRQDNDYAYVVYEQGGLAGTFQAFTGLWSEGDPEYSCAASPPPNRVQPKRGFGAVWCVQGGPSAVIGWGMGDEAGFGPGNGEPLVQDFEHGFIFRDSDGTTKGAAYVFFNDGSKFLRLIY